MDTQVKIKRTARDSVFTDLFSDPKYVLELYRTLHPEDTSTTTRDIKDAKLKCVLAEHEYNDLSFQVGEKLLMFIEAQSTWSEGIVLRMMSYAIQELNNYFTQKGISLYADGKFLCPKPELYVIYTGKRKHCPRTLSFSKVFLNDCKKCDLNATVHILRRGKHKNDIIQQYITFCKIFTKQVKKYRTNPRKAIEETIRICRKNKVLLEYLNRRETEIMDIMTMLFDQDTVTAQLKIHREREMKEKIEKEVQKQVKTKVKQVKKQIKDDIKKAKDDIKKAKDDAKKAKDDAKKAKDDAKKAKDDAKRANDDAKRANDDAKKAKDDAKLEIQKAKDDAKLEIQKAKDKAKVKIQKVKDDAKKRLKESKIETIIRTFQSLNKTYDETFAFLQSSLKITEKDIEGYMQNYWKDNK